MTTDEIRRLELSLIKDTNPDHFYNNKSFIRYMKNENIRSFGDWMFNNGYNAGVNSMSREVLIKANDWVCTKYLLPPMTRRFSEEKTSARVAIFLFRDDDYEPCFVARFIEHDGEIYVDDDDDLYCKLADYYERGYRVYWTCLPNFPALPKEDGNENCTQYY